MKTPFTVFDPNSAGQRPGRSSYWGCRAAGLALGVAALCCLPLFQGTAAAESVLKKAELTAVINEVKLLDPALGERGARIKDVVEGQIGVKTGIKSRAELLFQDKTLTRLGANTLFSFSEGTRDLELEHGTMLLQCPKGIGGAKIRTAAVTAAITGTTILLEYSPPPTPKRAPGYVPTIAEMTPDEAYAELQHPRRNYTKPEHGALEAKAKQRKKGASGGYVKVLVLEGTLRLFLNTRLGESVLVSAGQMIILDPHANVIPPPVQFDIARLAQTSLLVDNKFWGHVSTDLSMALVAKEVSVQSKQMSGGQLLPTNLVIPGAGTEVFTVAQLNEINQGTPAAILSQLQPVVTGGPIVTPPGLPPTQGDPQPTPPSVSYPVAINSPNPYVVGSGTVFNTDPSITTGGVTYPGTVYNPSTDGSPQSYFFAGSPVSFDSSVFGSGSGGNNNFNLAVFEFADLQLNGVPTIVTTGGAQYMVLLSQGPITTSAPGGVFNLDVLQGGIFISTVNGSITTGPEFSFTSTQTFVPTQNDSSLGLSFYARGATSNLTFGSDVNFADRQLSLDAGNNVVVSNQITALSSSDPLTRYDYDVNIRAGNDFILNSTGQITTSYMDIRAQDVVGSSGALVNAVNLEIDLGNAATLTQSGGLLYVETLPISPTNLQNFSLSGNAGVTVSGNLTISTAPNPSSGNFVGLLLHADAGDVVVNGNLTSNNDIQIETNHNFIMAPGTLVTANNVNINSILGGITLPGNVTFNTAPNPVGNNTNFVGVQINGDGQNTGPTGNIPGAAGDVTINGNLTTNNSLQINTSGNFIMGPGALVTAYSVEINSNLGGITLPGDVTFNTAPYPGGNSNAVGVYINGDGNNNNINIPGDVTVNGHLTTNNSLWIDASDNLILGPAGRITSPNITIQTQDVAGSGSAVIDGAGAQINIQIQNPATLTQSGNLVYVNTLPIDQTTPFQWLGITSTAGVNIPSNVNLNAVANGNYSTFRLVSSGALNINGTLTSTTDLNVQVQSLVVGPSALLQAPNVSVIVTDSVNPANVTVSGNNLLFNSLPIDLSAANTSASVSAPTIQVAPNLTLPGTGNGVTIGQTYPVYAPITEVFTGWTLDNVQVPGNITSNNGLNFDGNTTVTGNVNTGGLGVGVLTVDGTVNANIIYWNGAWSSQGSPYSNSQNNSPTGPAVTSPSSLTAPVVNAPSGLSFAGANEGSGSSNPAYPDDGHVFTLTTPTVVFDTSSAGAFIGPSVFDGGDALPGNGKPGGSGGTLNVNATGDVTVNTTISSTTGANANGVASGGNGGTVNLTTTAGAVTVNSTIQVSSDGLSAPTNRVSKQGGNITLQTGKPVGSGINVTNTGQLLALLNATAPGPGGTVQLISAGADINVSGKIQADRGTINVQNNGATGQVYINSTAQLAADVIKVGALGANGQLTIQAGSQLNAVNTLKLYGGTGTLGEVLFTGSGTVNLSGSAIHIAATTVQIGPSTQVNNSGSTFVHTTNANYGVGPGNGNFQNPVTRTPLSGAPSY